MPQVAARVAGWQRRLGGQAGPLGAVSAGSGESPSGAPLQVELFVGGSWVDITSFVMTRDGSGQVEIFRGQANEGNQPDPGRCTFQLNNRDGRFSPRNPTSPYYGLIGRNTPIRVSVPSGNEKSYRFWGEVAVWPQHWDTTGTDVWVDLEAAGILRRLGQGQTPLKSPMRREFSNAARVSIIAYWPCEDGLSATQIASTQSSRQPMTLTSGVALAAYSGWAASEPLPTVSTGSMTGVVTDYTSTSQLAVRFFMRLPDAGVPSIVAFLSLMGTGTATKWSVYADAAGALGVKAFDSLGSTLFDSGLVAFAVNGLQLSVGFELVQNGADVAWRLFTQNIDSSLFTVATGGTLASQTFGKVTSIRVGGEGDLGGAAFGHIALADSTAAYADTGGALMAWNGDGVASRVARLCAEEMVQYLLVSDGAVGNSVALGPQGAKTFLGLATEALYADDSILFEPTTFLGVAQRTRLSRYNQPAALALDYPSFHLSAVPTPIDDDQHTRNDITAVRPNGSSVQVIETVGALSVEPPPTGVGRYDETITVNVVKDADLLHQAGWHVHLGTVDEARYPQVSINLSHSSFTTNGALRQQALAVRIGDRLTISNPPTWIPPDNISQIVIGFNESIDGFQHRITYTCVPESPYQVAELDSATNDRLDTDGSSLTADVAAAATTFSVSTASGPLWTTSPEDVPFDVRASGEVMTVLTVGQDLLAGAGSFEAGVAGWTPQDCTFTQSAVQAKVGTYSGRLTVVGSPVQAYVRSASVPVSVGAQYRVSFWAYSVAGYSGVIAAIDWYTGGGGYLSTSTGSATVPAGTWTMITATGTAPATAGLAQAGPTLTGSPPAGETLYIDDAQFVPTASYLTSPQTFTVVRSVNSVAVAHQAGTDVRLSQPMILAL